MSNLKPKPLASHQLLACIVEVEKELSGFSVAELSTLDAQIVKNAFDDFKCILQSKIAGHKSESTQPLLKAPLGEKDSHNLGQQEMKPETLIAHVSHDLRTPLNGIIGFTDLLDETPLNEVQQGHVKAIRSASHHLLEVINELLAYSRLSSGKEKLAMIDFNLEGILQNVTFLCNTLILNKKVSIALEIDPNIPAVLQGDPSKLSQILLNLLGNAIKFVNEGTIHVNVQWMHQKDGIHWLAFEVKDTGIGIATDQLQNIFNAFSQAEENTFEKYGGYGLGLHIVHQLITQLRGKIAVRSTLGVGTTFTFQLPFAKAKKALIHAQEQQKEIATNAHLNTVKGMRILVFEDNILNQRLIAERLKSWGCKVHITDQLNYGLTVLKNSSIDLILMDLRMPEMDGFEVTRRIKECGISGASEIPIIALSADFSGNDKARCGAVGINDFILKPYSAPQLVSKIAHLKRISAQQKGVSKSKNAIPRNTQQGKERIHLRPLLAECMGQIDLMEELIKLFQQNVLEFIEKTKNHLEKKDFKGIEFAAHKMKPGLLMMQLNGLHQKMIAIHQNAKEKTDISGIALLYQEFVAAYPIAENAIHFEIERLKNERNSQQ
ncbi:ATP-binding protein [Arenibacter sp. GZD96]|uniref:hybrid sensor histidine kinase/response regulator n=1 Tax=Aurantibrevibacter litoralis TaxID=3106030 RepID=UPI002AFF1899|nr:ATP-binding protein [Arenibacter sp. GZD-96]MEA1785324.1 ATP-binding protein [Arenibacter sp. GZD-96]